MADDAPPTNEENVTVTIKPSSENTSDVIAADPNDNADDNVEAKTPNVNWNDEDIVLADKDNKTSKPEYYLRSDVKMGGKIVEDAIEDATHPYDHPNCLIRWFYKITYVLIIQCCFMFLHFVYCVTHA